MKGKFFDLQLGVGFDEIEDKKAATEILKTALRFSDAEIVRIAQGKTRILATRLAEQDAQGYKGLLEKAGVPCSMLASIKIASLKRESTHYKEKRRAEPSETALTACPACGTIQNQADVCTRCGTGLKEQGIVTE